jgi:hypothetical protein
MVAATVNRAAAVSGCPMKQRILKSALVPLLALAAFPAGSESASASERERQFFRQVEGRWSGPGEIVAGKYKGTKFICNFIGSQPDGKVGMSLDGGCRVGLFTQKMSASIEKARKGYRGSFMDGAAGKGLDVIGGSVTGNKVVFSLNRKALDGAMLARLPDDNTMNVTVSVKVEDEMVPVIGLSLKRIDERQVGAVVQE